jgi:hypothetical protein
MSHRETAKILELFKGSKARMSTGGKQFHLGIQGKTENETVFKIP